MPVRPAPHRRRIASLAVALTSGLLALLVATGAHATQTLYALGNHPDGNAQPPPYGLRLDELFDATAGKDVFAFDFERAGAGMALLYDDGGTPGDLALGDDTVRIFGTVFGGLDTGSDFGDPLYAGFWVVDFTYTSNFTSVGPDGSQIEVNPDSPNNAGTITPTFAVGGDGATLGVPIPFFDYEGGMGFSFRFNNTENHRLAGSGLSGPETFVGWGWLLHGDTYVADSDWLFTATVVPEPGTGAMVALGLTLLAARRRR